MSTLVLNNIEKTVRRVQYHFSYSADIDKYFSEKPFWIEYPDNIESVPDSILAVPFVCNVLPIVWLTDSTLVIPELDEAFFNCLSDVKKGYETMYPETEWKGNIEVGKIVPCDREAEQEKCAMFYSGGVDSVQTLISHLDEKPMLISIWGSDVKVDNAEGWNVLFKAISEASERFQLPTATIRSTFREFDNEGLLDRDFHEKLHDGWWHGAKHGLALLGHVAPLSYIYGFGKMYIASTHCPEDGKVTCASNPLIDDNVRFVGCQVMHDGFIYSRQRKIHNIIEYSKANDAIPLHVCWESQTGGNCSKCEKCFRTIVGIIAEGDNPERYGFQKYKNHLKEMQTVVSQPRFHEVQKSYWTKIKKAVNSNYSLLSKTEEWKYLSWITKTDFEHPETIKLPLSLRLKQAKGIRGKLAEFKFYQRLHKVKAIILGKNR